MNVKGTNCVNTELPMKLLDWMDESKLDWRSLSNNPSPEAIKRMKETPNKINWYQLSENISPDAIQILRANINKVDWDWYKIYWDCYKLKSKERPLNTSFYIYTPKEINYLRENPDEIDWRRMSYNKSEGVLVLLKDRPDKINWYGLSRNPHIFVYDYKKMRENMSLFREDLMKNRFHPRNIPKFRDWGVPGFEDYEDDDE
jgi:hypothetical protein